MERKIGEEFDFCGHTLKVKKSYLGYCFGCFFYQRSLACFNSYINGIVGICSRNLRQEGNNVIFKEQ